MTNGPSDPTPESPVDPRPLSPAVTVAVIAATTIVALLLGETVAGINGVVLALIFGLLLANVVLRRDTDHQVTRFVLGPWLKTSIVFLGAGVNLALLQDIAGRILIVIAIAIVIGLVMAYYVGRAMNIGRRPSILIGVGTAICGASAIAAVAPVIGAKKKEIAIALATIFTFNALALITYPIIGTWLGLDQTTFGAWAGVGVHDTATSIATGFAYGDPSGEIATLTKLTRTLFLVPVMLFLASRPPDPDTLDEKPRRFKYTIPWFIVGFVVMAIANTAGALGTVGDLLNEAAKIAVVAVVATTALSIRLREAAGLGRDVGIAGIATSLAVGVVSLGLLIILI